MNKLLPILLVVVLSGCNGTNQENQATQSNMSKNKECVTGKRSGNGMILSNLIRDKKNSDFSYRQNIGLAQISLNTGGTSEYRRYKSIAQQYKNKSSNLNDQIINEMHRKALDDLNYNSTDRMSELWSYYWNRNIQVKLKRTCEYSVIDNGKVLFQDLNKSEIIDVFQRSKE